MDVSPEIWRQKLRPLGMTLCFRQAEGSAFWQCDYHFCLLLLLLLHLVLPLLQKEHRCMTSTTVKISEQLNMPYQRSDL
jgi:hypothetical protein